MVAGIGETLATAATLRCFREGVVSVGNTQGWCVRDTRHVLAFVSLSLPEPNKQAEHGHDDQEQKDDAHDSTRGLAL